MPHATGHNCVPQGTMQRVRLIADSGATKAALTGLLGLVALTGCAAGEAPQPSEAISEAPGAEQTEANERELQTIEEFIEKIELNAQDYATGEEVVRAFFEESHYNWYNSVNGADISEFIPPSGTFAGPIANEINAPYDSAFLDTVFVDGWQENPNLAQQAKSGIKGHEVVTYLYMFTDNDVMETDIEPYRGMHKLDSVQITSEDDATINATVIRYYQDNGNRNRADSLIESPFSYDNLAPENMTFVNVDGKWRVSEWTIGFTPQS